MFVLPEVDDTLYFPKEGAELIRIGWYQDLQWREADYYRVMAYTIEKSEKSLGDILSRARRYDTLLFIARERFDAVYFDVPDVLKALSKDHINTQFSIVNYERDPNIKDPVTWYKTIIDKRFFYGQDKEKKFRWLVFHQPERKPAQGRFVESSAQRIAENVISALPAFAAPVGGVSFSFDENTAKKVKSLGVTLLGNLLHQFGAEEKEIPELSEEVIDKALEVAKEQQKNPESRAAAVFTAAVTCVPQQKRGGI